MNKSEMNLKMRTIIISIVINFFISWTILPFAIPPFRAYSMNELIEVLLWQGIGMIGWPLAIPGVIFSFLFNHKINELRNFFFILIYPGILFLIIRILFSKHSKLWELLLVNLLITLSFIAVWYSVLNGYIFNGG